MSLLIDLQLVPDRILWAVKDRILANRDAMEKRRQREGILSEGRDGASGGRLPMSSGSGDGYSEPPGHRAIGRRGGARMGRYVRPEPFVPSYGGGGVAMIVIIYQSDGDYLGHTDSEIRIEASVNGNTATGFDMKRIRPPQPQGMWNTVYTATDLDVSEVKGLSVIHSILREMVVGLPGLLGLNYVGTRPDPISEYNLAPAGQRYETTTTRYAPTSGNAMAVEETNTVRLKVSTLTQGTYGHFEVFFCRSDAPEVSMPEDADSYYFWPAIDANGNPVNNSESQLHQRYAVTYGGRYYFLPNEQDAIFHPDFSYGTEDYRPELDAVYLDRENNTLVLKGVDFNASTYSYRYPYNSGSPYWPIVDPPDGHPTWEAYHDAMKEQYGP